MSWLDRTTTLKIPALEFQIKMKGGPEGFSVALPSSSQIFHEVPYNCLLLYNISWQPVGWLKPTLTASSPWSHYIGPSDPLLELLTRPLFRLSRADLTTSFRAAGRAGLWMYKQRIIYLWCRPSSRLVSDEAMLRIQCEIKGTRTDYTSVPVTGDVL